MPVSLFPRTLRKSGNPSRRPGRPLALVVEDDASLRGLLGRWLRASFAVTEVDSAPAAIAVLERQPVALVVTDFRMRPGRSGVELLMEVQRRWPKTARFLTSGEAVVGLERWGERGIVEAFFRKPWHGLEIYEAAEEFVARNSARPPAGRKKRT